MLIINVSTPNDHLGDYLRDSFVKVNTNFQEAVETIALKAPISNPAFIGTPTAPTAPLGTSNNQIATTEFVINNSGSGGSSIYWSGGTGLNSIRNTNGEGSATGGYSLSFGYNSHTNGYASSIFGNNSSANADSVHILGDGIIGVAPNTTYVNNLNINTLSNDTAIKSLGIDSVGKVVSGGLLMSKVIELNTWERNKQYRIFTGLDFDSTIVDVKVTIVSTVVNNGYQMGDVVSVNGSEPNDAGGTPAHGIGVQYNPTISDSFKINIEDKVFIPSAYTADGDAGGTYDLFSTIQWKLRFVVLYTT